MPANVIMIWDYDTPIATITTTRPYNYDFEKCIQESHDVDTILDYAKSGSIDMTFAVVGFGAEKSVYPFDIREKIRKIHRLGHEIASHSWKHEWIPYLTRYQIEKTIERSKHILEECLEIKDSIKGFVPPHDRPMSWPARMAFSLGDRALYPFHPGANIGSLLSELRRKNYAWCRTTYRPLWQKLADWRGGDIKQKLKKDWENSNGMIHFRGTICGFEKPTLSLLEKAIKDSLTIVIVSHPAGLSRKGNENIVFFEKFMNYLISLKIKGDVKTFTVSNYISQSGLL
jgi:hypothetical protein